MRIAAAISASLADGTRLLYTRPPSCERLSTFVLDFSAFFAAFLATFAAFFALLVFLAIFAVLQLWLRDGGPHCA